MRKYLAEQNEIWKQNWFADNESCSDYRMANRYECQNDSAHFAGGGGGEGALKSYCLCIFFFFATDNHIDVPQKDQY